MTGKQWEQCIQRSCDKRVIFCKKLADGTGSWSRESVQVRFQQSNECDFVIFDSAGNGTLLLLEAKVHKGASIPLGCIRESQVKGLLKRSVYDRVICGILVFFRDYEEAYFFNIQDYIKFTRIYNRKSIPLSYFQQNATKVKIKKKQVNYDISIEDIFKSKEE